MDAFTDTKIQFGVNAKVLSMSDIGMKSTYDDCIYYTSAKYTDVLGVGPTQTL